ncbi:hypothetical protein GOBAR_DD18340 [Gossypium barbadense]|nr:hypothetical protein GOBAR_DD18340 [Gossypium barbadense]
MGTKTVTAIGFSKWGPKDSTSLGIMASSGAPRNKAEAVLSEEEVGVELPLTRGGLIEGVGGIVGLGGARVARVVNAPQEVVHIDEGSSDSEMATAPNNVSSSEEADVEQAPLNSLNIGGSSKEILNNLERRGLNSKYSCERLPCLVLATSESLLCCLVSMVTETGCFCSYCCKFR